MNLKERVTKILEVANQRVGAKKTLEDELRTIDGQTEEVAVKKTRLEQAGTLLQRVADRLQEEGIGKVEDFVTAGLRQVYGDETYKFEIEWKFKFERYEIHFFVTDELNGRHLKLELKTGRGWGVADVASVLLQAAVVAALPDALGLVATDDPLSHLDPERLEVMKEIIRELSEDVQFLITTTDPALAEIGGVKHEIITLPDGSAGIKTE